MTGPEWEEDWDNPEYAREDATVEAYKRLIAGGLGYGDTYDDELFEEEEDFEGFDEDDF